VNPGTATRVALAGFVATLLAAVTLHPLVRDLAWALPTVVVLAIVVGSGAAMRQVVRSWPVVVLVQLAAFAVTMTALFARDEAIWGVLPGPEAIRALGSLVSDGLSVTREAAAPVPDTTGVILLVVGGMALVGLVVDLLAVSLHQPAVAGLPLLSVYCVPAAVLPGGIGWIYFAAAAAGYLVLVGADSSDRIRGWGRVLGGRTDGAGALGGPLSGARRVAAMSVAVAVVVPLLIPGLGERLLSSGSGDGTGKGNGQIKVINPILDLNKNLGSRSKDPVITYETAVTAPDPLRIVTDDAFDGARWAPTTGPISRKQKVQTSIPQAPGLSSAVPVQRALTTIAIGNLKETYLPLPYPTYQVDVQGDWLYETGSLNVVGDGVVTNNLSYTAHHLVVQPTAAQLKAAGPAPASVSGPFTKLPDNMPAVIRQLAVQVAGTGTAYEQAVRLQDYLRNTGGFVYDEKASGANGDDSGQGAVVNFLTGKHGYCVQFASTMAVMARTLGIPSRVAVGFLPGHKTATGSYAITLQDAHAWPELYFDGVGWVRFEPTPATRVQSAPAYSLPAQSSQAKPSVSVSAAAPNAGLPAPAIRPAKQLDETSAPQTPILTRIWQAIPWQFVAVLAALVLLLLVPLALSRWARRQRWARARTASAVAEAAWADLRDRLGDLGVGWTASWTPRALQRRLIMDHGLGGSERAALGRLVADIESARYAAPGAARVERTAAQARGDVQLIADAVAQTTSTRTRRLARWLPKSGIDLLTGAGRRVDVAAEDAGRRAGMIGAQVRKAVSSGRR